MTGSSKRILIRLILGAHLPLRLFVVLGMLLGMLGAIVPGASAASVSKAEFSGGAGTVTVGGTLYAKQGAALTLTVTTDSDTQCVRVTDGPTSVDKAANSARTSWTFTSTDSAALFTAGSGNGVKSVTATAFRNSNNKGGCIANGGEKFGTQNASYVLDNTGPVVTGALSPAPNAAGWNNADVTITWTATDPAGINTITPASDLVNVNTTTAGVAKTATATDRLGNVGTGSATVKLDETLPTINSSKSPAANAAGWNNTDVTVSFTCADALSGIKSCTGGGSVIVFAEGANQAVPGTAVDNADNVNNAGVTGINIDKTAPSLSGAPTTSPNAAGWFNGNVTIRWTASDGLSGLVGSVPADTTITDEGSDLTASTSVSDKAGNLTSTTSSPAVKIDKTVPNTTVTAPANWNNTNVTVSLNPTDALSGVAATYYKLDGGAQQTYNATTKIAISDEGTHTLQFWSVDNAGNAEAAKTVEVKIDKTPPTINHTQSPAANANGWNNANVTVTFICTDTGGSGLASCTAPQTVTTEGQNQAVTGTARDNAGNTATDPATVSIDKTAPTITATAARPANENGWYDKDVTVGFTCGDPKNASNGTDGSGLASCAAQQTLGEGANQSASGGASDAAGNTASVTLGGINIDKTAPILSGKATTTPNDDGWYGGDVTVAWTCTDALSGVATTPPASSVVSGEGDNLSATATCTDKAGNVANVTVSGIKIDRTAPSTLASYPAPLDSGWYAGAVLVTLTTGADLSGVDKTYYSIDGGAAQEYTAPFSHALKGSHTITFWSVDKAGNVEDKAAPGHSITLKIDGVPPTITGNRTPDANSFGWNNGPVTVSFACDDAESGIAGCTDPTALGNEGAGQSVTGNAVDNAGNTNSATVGDVNIDLTTPTLTGAATTNPNAAGWYKGDVTIAWTGQDGLSGIDPATQPANSIITGEGSNVGTGPVSISDKAGNVGVGSVNGIKIDRTAPTIGGATVNDDGTARSANTAGWFNGAVRVRFSCDDILSGVQECASDVVLSGDGANQNASGTATDNADNTATANVTGIKIDSKAPQTTANNVCDGKNGWCRGQTATVVLTATDQAGLSGVKEIRYIVNGGPEQTASGNKLTPVPGGVSVSVTVPLAAKSGVATVEFFAVDNAGNAEAKGGASLKYDNIAPTVTHTVNPEANAAGWNNADTTVHFDAKDDDGGSGVDVATVTPEVKVSAETSATGQVIKGEASDLAGNTGTDSVTIKLDKTAPAITGAIVSGTKGANDWYTGPVTVRFTCTDTLSGIATCPADVVLTTNGANQSASGKAVDVAGNEASATVSGINIDSTPPTITVSPVKGINTLGEMVSISCTAVDTYTKPDGATAAGSGIDASGCKISVTGGTANGVGDFTYTATATDNAGNTNTVNGGYKVIYRWDGFLQPINDTAHQVGVSTSIFKGGSTVPTKFQVKRADGTIVQVVTAPVWLTPAKGSPTTAPVDESQYSDPATSGTTYRWDATAQQYIYNWGTPKNGVGFYYRIGVKLDDGQTYYVNIGLR